VPGACRCYCIEPASHTPVSAPSSASRSQHACSLQHNPIVVQLPTHAHMFTLQPVHRYTWHIQLCHVPQQMCAPCTWPATRPSVAAVCQAALPTNACFCTHPTSQLNGCGHASPSCEPQQQHPRTAAPHPVTLPHSATHHVPRATPEPPYQIVYTQPAICLPGYLLHSNTRQLSCPSSQAAAGWPKLSANTCAHATH
jgi:hypothetical protein